MKSNSIPIYNIPIYNYTLLIWASSNGHTDIVQLWQSQPDNTVNYQDI